MTPRSSADYARRRQRVLLALLLAVRRVWRQMRPGDAWEDRYAAEIGPQVLALVLAAQVATTRDADAYVAAVLAELALDQTATPGVVPSTALVGVTGDGRPVQSLLATSIGRARARVAELRTDVEVNESAAALMSETTSLRVDLRDTEQMRQQALGDAERWMGTVVSTILADTARAVESIAITQNENVGGWVRMLNPPSCSRCVILAGRFYRWSDGFERHPGCDCVHIPAAESMTDDLRVNPGDYFDTLSAAEQDRIFGKAGAQAIRDGADINQVVNVRRGVQTAQVYGRDLLVTTAGASRRAKPRLMPESIYALADGDRAEAIRLLRLNGFLT